MARRNGGDDAIYDVDGYPLFDKEQASEPEPPPEDDTEEGDDGEG
ncbi:hypothetical protein [Streptomyces sp. NPDC053560]